MVDARICASATIIYKDPGLDVSGFSKRCAEVSGSAVASLPGETVIFDDSSIVIGLAAGGVNLTNDYLSYTIQYDWRWAITTSVSGPIKQRPLRFGFLYGLVLNTQQEVVLILFNLQRQYPDGLLLIGLAKSGQKDMRRP